MEGAYLRGVSLRKRKNRSIDEMLLRRGTHETCVMAVGNFVNVTAGK